jgi:hypothetical protein
MALIGNHPEIAKVMVVQLGHRLHNKKGTLALSSYIG